jgi:hypothetical protein
VNVATDGPARRSLVALIAGVAVVAFGIAVVGLIAFTGPLHSPPLGALGYGTVFAAPGILALLGRRERPALLLAAALAAFLVAFASLSVVGLVLWMPAVAFLVAYALTRHRAPRSRDLLAPLVAVPLLVAAPFAALISEDPRCWAIVRSGGQERLVELPAERFVRGSSIRMDSRDLPRGANESGCESDVISNVEGLLAIAIVGAAVAAAVVVSPRSTPALVPAPT